MGNVFLDRAKSGNIYNWEEKKKKIVAEKQQKISQATKKSVNNENLLYNGAVKMPEKKKTSPAVKLPAVPVAVPKMVTPVPDLSYKSYTPKLSVDVENGKVKTKASVPVKNNQKVALPATNQGPRNAALYKNSFLKEANKYSEKKNVENAIKDYSLYKEIGQYGLGNIDLFRRPQYKNEDGSISTVSSMSINENGIEILIPTITFDKNNKAVKLSEKEAIDHYHKTGEFLGKFMSVEEANEYADFLHKAQEFYYDSKYKTTAKENVDTAEINPMLGYYDDTGFEDITYDYINKNKTAKERQLVNDVKTKSSFLGIDKSFLEGMTDDEIRIYNYLYKKSGKNTAEKFIKEIEGDLNYRQRIAAEKRNADYAEEHPVASSAATVVTSPLKVLSYVGQVEDYLEDGKVDQNAGYNKFSYNNSAIRSKVAEKIEKSGQWGKVGSYAYNLGMSMGDFVFNTAITGGSSALSLAIMGTGAAADTVITSKDKGLSDNQAMALGTIAGAAEIIFEKMSIDKLFSDDFIKHGIKQYIKANALTEGLEETGTSLVNLFADILISKDKSDWQQSIKKYMENGYTKGQAIGMTMGNQALSLGADFLGGVISGGLLAGGSAVANYMGISSEGKRNVKKTNDILNYGMKAEKGSLAYENAQKLKEKDDLFKTGDAKKGISNFDLGRQLILNEQFTAEELGKSNRENISKIIDLGMKQKTNSDAYADAVNLKGKLDSGKNITDEEIGEAVRDIQKEFPEIEIEKTNVNPETSSLLSAISRSRGGAELTENDIQLMTNNPEIFEAYTGVKIQNNAEAEIRKYVEEKKTENARTNSIISAISDKTGLSFDYDATLPMNIAGYYDGKNKKIMLNPASDKKIDYAVVHELTHYVESKKGYAAYKNNLMKSNFYLNEFLVKNNYNSVEDFKEVTRKEYKEVYKNLTADEFEEAIEYEMCAKVTEELINSEPEALARLSKNDTGIKAVFNEICEFFEEILTKLNGESEKAYALKKARQFRKLVGENKGIDTLRQDVKYYINPNFEKAFDNWYYNLKRKNALSLKVGSTSTPLKTIGVKEHNIYWDTTKINTTLKDHPDISKDTLKQVPYLLENPIIILQSRSKEGNNRILLFGDLYNENNLPVAAVLELEPEKTPGSGIRLDEIKIVSTHARVDETNPTGIYDTQNLIENSKTMYINPNKKETYDWMARTGVQFPFLPSSSGLVNSVTYKYSTVNNNSMPNSKKYSITKPSESSNSQTVEKPEARKRVHLIPQNNEVFKTEDIRHKVTQKILKDFSVPINSSDRAELKKMIDAALVTVEKGDIPSGITTDAIFSHLVESSRVMDDSAYNEFKDLKDLIKSTKLHFSEEVRRDFPEAEKFRKANMGTLALNNNEGRGIDDFYQELCNSYPDVFSDEIINSADQLREISDVAKSITRENISVIEAGKREGLNKEHFENILKSAFEEHFVSYFENEAVKGSDKIKKKQKQKYIELKAGRPYGELTELEMNDYNSRLDKELEKFKKNKDIDSVEKILNTVDKGSNRIIDTTEYIELNDGAPEMDDYTLENFRTVPAQFIKGNQLGMTFDGKDIYRINDMVSNKSKDVRSWLSNLIEKPLENAKGEYVNSLRDKVNFVYDKIVKELGIEMNSKESAAVQWYGEGMKPQKKGNPVSYSLQDLKTEFSDKWQDIVKADKLLRQVYNEYIDSVNNVLKQLYPYVERDAEKLQKTIEMLQDKMDVLDKEGQNKAKNKIKELSERIDNLYTNRRLRPRKDYYRHFQEEGGSLSSLMNILKTDIQISPDLIKVSENTKPLTKWWGAMQHRQGEGNYKADAVGAILNYIPNAEYKIHIEPFIGHMRKVINTFARDTATTKNANGYIQFLTEWANDLAGKTNTADRTVQNKLSRKIMSVVGWVGGRARANAIVGNLRTAVVQVFNLPNATMYIKNPKDWGNGVKNMILDTQTGNNIINQSVFLRERYLDDIYSKFKKGIKYTPSKLCNFMLTAGDKAATTYIWYSAYSEGVRKKMDNPVLHADRITRRAVAGRGIGELPLMQKSKVIQAIAPFQVEVANSWEIMKEKGRQGDLIAFLLYSATAWALNSLSEAIFGDKVIPDVIDIISDTVKKFDDEESVSKNVGQAALRLGGGVMSAMPYASVIASAVIPDEELREEVFGDDDPSRYGVGVFGLEQITNMVVKMIAGTIEEDDYIDFAASYLLPYGGKQIARTYKGYKDMSAGGSYTNKGQLRFPITTPADKTKTLLFGAYSTKKGQEYLEKLKPLGDKQTKIYKQMINLHNGRKYQDEIFYTFKGYSEYKKKLGKTVLNKADRKKYVDTLSPLSDMPDAQHIRDWFINAVDVSEKKK